MGNKIPPRGLGRLPATHGGAPTKKTKLPKEQQQGIHKTETVTTPIFARLRLDNGKRRSIKAQKEPPHKAKPEVKDAKRIWAEERSTVAKNANP
ncbi:MAG TPA: hypothetical protein VLG76_02845 [Rhabdochlamydiaceae bacterium]|nr:hypothetical protein [Rhabdochlamydiaceae bacterium]